MGLIKVSKTLLFQSALPRGERRPDNTGRQMDAHISIRAPARGATCKG